MKSALLLRGVGRSYFPQVVILGIGLIWIVAMGAAGAWPGAVINVIFAVYLFVVIAALIAMDARFMVLPDGLVIALAAGGLAHALMSGLDAAAQAVASGAVIFGAALLFRSAYRWLRGIDGLGLGDVKLAGAGALWIGMAMAPLFIGIAVASALISLAIERLDGRPLSGQQAIPFGPHLAISLWLTWLYGLGGPLA